MKGLSTLTGGGLSLTHSRIVNWESTVCVCVCVCVCACVCDIMLHCVPATIVLNYCGRVGGYQFVFSDVI